MWESGSASSRTIRAQHPIAVVTHAGVHIDMKVIWRMDGRVTHFTDAGGNALAFTVSIGGLFGQR